MNILMLADRLVLGGLETHIISYVNQMLRRGYNIMLGTEIPGPASPVEIPA